MLSQLVYVSARNSKCSNAEIEKILDSCKRNNPNFEITGVLLYSDKKFIQYLEGESKEILGLYDKIKLDPRHERVMMVSYGPIKEKIFPSWHMGTRQLTEEDVYFRTDITSEDKDVFNLILSGKEQNGNRVQVLLQKFFK
jgi:hypothetical protein